jgi:hypothetical protein|tara:strand:- start:837 stop:1001 length:165 start_codon:yes stop_codon:yes gene_type:complete
MDYVCYGRIVGGVRSESFARGAFANTPIFILRDVSGGVERTQDGFDAIGDGEFE